MNQRERFLAVLLVLLIVGGASGVAGYIFVWEPLKQKKEQLAKLDTEVKDLRDKKTLLDMQQFEYETSMRKMSLPLEIEKISQYNYKLLLNRLAREAKFDKPLVESKAPNNKTNVPQLAGKKPIYTMLDFDLELTGDLQNFIGFLYNFYRQPLLQQIKTLTITRLATSRGGETRTGRDLMFKLTIQALVLDRAEDRGILLALDPDIARLIGGGGATAFSIVNVESGQGPIKPAFGVLARGEDKDHNKATALAEYSRIAGKNIFFDAPPRSPGSGGGDKKGTEGGEFTDSTATTKEDNFGPYLQLTRISHCNGVSKALINDRLRHREFEVEMTANGVIVVSAYHFVANKNPEGAVVESDKTLTYQTRYLDLGKEQLEKNRRYLIRGILESELVLEAYDPSRDKLIKGPDALALGGAGASVIVPSKVLVWGVGYFMTTAPKETLNGLHDPKFAATELTSAKAIRELLTRPVAVDNEGNGTVEFLSGGTPPPPDIKKIDGKKTDGKGKGRKGGN